MAEKSALRAENYGGSGACDGPLPVAFKYGRVCDVRRGFVQAGTMAQLAAVLRFLQAAEAQCVIAIVRIKDRFVTPSPGGWADCMVNFYFEADAARHICELQLVRRRCSPCRHRRLALTRCHRCQPASS